MFYREYTDGVMGSMIYTFCLLVADFQRNLEFSSTCWWLNLIRCFFFHCKKVHCSARASQEAEINSVLTTTYLSVVRRAPGETQCAALQMSRRPVLVSVKTLWHTNTKTALSPFSSLSFSSAPSLLPPCSRPRPPRHPAGPLQPMRFLNHWASFADCFLAEGMLKL